MLRAIAARNGTTVWRRCSVEARLFFLEDPDADRAMRDLDKIVTGIQKRGFRFVVADKLVQKSSSP